MPRLLFLALLFAAVCVPPGSGGPIPRAMVGGEVPVPSYRRATYPATFAGGQRAAVIIVGSGRTYMGLYVLDADGNCVAWDDLGADKAPDRCAVEWFPPKEQRYTIEVRNFGAVTNVIGIALR
jgi:hypothetical protein